MSEVWLPVVGWEGCYEISDHGRIRSLARTVTRKNGRPQSVGKRILKTYTCSKYGHQSVKMKDHGVRGSMLIHRMVLEAFRGPCPEGRETRHLNGDARDNKLSNLCWGTSAENSEDIFEHGHQYPLQRKTHCPYGHEYDGTTVTTGALKADGTPGRKRICRICRNERVRRKFGRTPRGSATHCKRGHPFTEANTYVYDGSRRCKTCQIERQRQYRANTPTTEAG
jgi:HNH endonuclease/NUMOD4 motif